MRESGSHGEAEGLPTSGFSHSFPVTSSPAPTSAVHRRCSLGSRPRGLRLGGNSIQMELFFHIFGGEGRKVWEKATGTRKTEGRSRFTRGLVSTAPFLQGVPGSRGGLGGETEAQSTPPRAVSWLTVKSLTPAPSSCGCKWGDGMVRITPPSVGRSCLDWEFSAAGRAQTWLSLIQRLEGEEKPPPPPQP